jgi:ERCC4-type nuclease
MESLPEKDIVNLVIDNREVGLIEKLSNYKIIVEQLEIGDILYRKGDEVLLVIERKTINDLKASICDGRSREQKARLLATYPKERIMYLIEGNLDKPIDTKVSGVPVGTLIGSLINTQLRDGIKVYKTQTMEETANFVQKLHDKLVKDGDCFFTSCDEPLSASKYASTLKKSKKSNMTGEVWFISQLALIPQVSEVVANEIVKKYTSVSKLLLEYESTPINLRPTLLSNILFPIKNSKSRRIGDKISTRVYHFFYNITQEIEVSVEELSD